MPQRRGSAFQTNGCENSSLYSSSNRFFDQRNADQSSPCKPTRASTTFTGSRTVWFQPSGPKAPGSPGPQYVSPMLCKSVRITNSMPFDIGLAQLKPRLNV